MKEERRKPNTLDEILVACVVVMLALALLSEL